MQALSADQHLFHVKHGALAAAFCISLVPCLATAQPTSRVPETSTRTAALENRCGWFHNPTPGNATLTDRDGEWEISSQGGFSADGDWPDFTDAQWVQTNGHDGYGCACMKVGVDRSERRVLRIASATAKPLKVCRADKALAKP